MAEVDYVLRKSHLLIELECARLHGERARRRAGGSELVDDPHAHMEFGEPQRQYQARRTGADDEHIGLMVIVDLAHAAKAER
jgi:hypothetical protein